MSNSNDAVSWYFKMLALVIVAIVVSMTAKDCYKAHLQHDCTSIKSLGENK